jgi:hypothetical protein
LIEQGLVEIMIERGKIGHVRSMESCFPRRKRWRGLLENRACVPQRFPQQYTERFSVLEEES